MVRTPVVSSNLVFVGCDPDSKSLEVEFRRGKAYIYCCVPEIVIKGKMQSSLRGSFLRTSVKDIYGFQKC